MALDPKRWTHKTTEAVQAAMTMAAERSNPEVTPVHLLLALIGQPDGVVLPVLQKVGVAPAQLKCDVCNRTGFTNLGSLNNHRAFCTWIRTLVPRNPILNPRQKAGQSGQAVRPKGPKSSQQQQQQQARNPLKRTLSTPTTSVFEVSAKHARHNTTDTPTGTIRIKQEEGVEPKTPAFQGTTVIELEDDSEDEDGEEEMVQGHNTPKVTFEWVQDQSAPKVMYECEFCSRASGNRGAMLQHMKYCYYRHGADPNTIINPTQTVVG